MMIESIFKVLPVLMILQGFIIFVERVLRG